jgi:hypothetical protein
MAAALFGDLPQKLRVPVVRNVDRTDSIEPLTRSVVNPHLTERPLSTSLSLQRSQ